MSKVDAPLGHRVDNTWAVVCPLTQCLLCNHNANKWDSAWPAASCNVYCLRPSFPLTQILLQLKVHVCLSVWRICLAVCLATQWRPLCTEMDVVSCLTVLLFA